nr:diagnostic antigen gp50 [Hymenolepis microstoma]
MDKVYTCESCSIQGFESSDYPSQLFSTQEELIQHITHHHLSKKIERGRTIFVCTYGPSGICSMLSTIHSNTQNCATFESEYEYERHLVTKHLISSLQSSSFSRSKKNTFLEPPSHSWMQYDSVVNMAAVLNDPTDRQLDIFSRYWGEGFERATVPPLRVPIITEEHFFPYLSVLSKRKKCSPIHQTPSPHHSEPLNKETESVYCSRDFNLSDPETFNRVIPLHRRRQCSNLKDIFIHQSEKLSQHLDVVELAIANHVSERSPAFFEAVRTHDVVKDQLSQTISQVNAVRTRLEEVDSVYCRSVGQVVKLARRRENLKKVLVKLEMILSVRGVQPTIQSLLQNNDFCSALDLISHTRESLTAINNTAEIVCLRHLDAQLTEIEKFINNMIESEFDVALHSFFSSPSGETVVDANTITEALLPSILGLARIGQANFVEAIEKEIQQALNETLEKCQISLQPVENGHASEDSNTTPLEGEPFSAWLGKLKVACLCVENLVTRVKLIVESIAAISVGEEHIDRLRGLYWKTADRGQQKLSSLVSSHLRRARQLRINRSITSSEHFVAFAELVEDFHERVIIPAWHCYRPELPLVNQSMTLRNLAATQAAVLVKNFHEERCRILNKSLDQETWRPAERVFDPALSGLLNHLLTHHELNGSSSDDQNEQTPKSTKLLLQGETYVVVDTIFTLILLIFDYLRLGEQLAKWPLQLQDIQQNLSKFLALFNSRSCKLVLGAEALERQILKKIVARNMALVIRSLECLLVLIPVLNVYFERIHFKSLQSKMDGRNQKVLPRFTDAFHDVKQAIQSHISKVLYMLTGLLATRISRIIQTWQPRPPTPSAEMRQVCQAISKLTDSTSEILSEMMLNVS